MGKSCVLNRYTKNEYTDNYKCTIGVDFLHKILTIDEGKMIKLQLWDTVIISLKLL